VTWWAWAAVAAVVWLTLSVTIGLATAAWLDRHYLNDPTESELTNREDRIATPPGLLDRERLHPRAVQGPVREAVHRLRPACRHHLGAALLPALRRRTAHPDR
jgi:hypothetical protein